MYIKICGLTRPEHAEAAEAAGADMIGLMFAEKSRRHLSVEDARRVLSALKPHRRETVHNLALPGSGGWFQRCALSLEERIAARRPLVVGVFVGQPPSLVNAVTEMLDLDLIQLSGGEPWEQCLQLHRPVIKAVKAGEGADPQAIIAAAEAGTAVLTLLDADVPGEDGGTGIAADWVCASTVAAALPVMLAGGLTPQNVGEAVRRVRPWAVDVSTGVERDGTKDAELIEAFVRVAREASQGW